MYKRLLLLLSLPLLLHARKALEHPQAAQAGESPWFTGPLITPSGHVIPFGHANYEPYFYWTDVKGAYNNHWNYVPMPPSFKTLLSQTSIQFGILPNVELDLLPQFLYNNCGGQHMWRISDFPIAMAFQLLMDHPDNWWPAVKFRVGAVIPFGKYDRLKPSKLYTDDGGFGNWAPSLAFVSVRTYHVGGPYYFSWRMGLIYSITVPLSVHGFSIYGGAPTIDGVKGTRGTIYPGCIFVVQEGFEFSLSQNWSLALDLQYEHVNRTRFSGHSPAGTKPVLPSAEQFSVAPAIEYNFSANVGLIAGPWFTVAGRNDNNSDAFLAWVFAINIYH